jgi:hypothetical protein
MVPVPLIYDEVYIIQIALFQFIGTIYKSQFFKPVSQF